MGIIKGWWEPCESARSPRRVVRAMAGWREPWQVGGKHDLVGFWGRSEEAQEAGVSCGSGGSLVGPRRGWWD